MCCYFRGVFNTRGKGLLGFNRSLLGRGFEDDPLHIETNKLLSLPQMLRPSARAKPTTALEPQTAKDAHACCAAESGL